MPITRRRLRNPPTTRPDAASSDHRSNHRSSSHAVPPASSASTSAASRRSISRRSASARRSSAATTRRAASAERSMCDDEILHDAGAGMQLPVGELFQDDRAQKLVVGRRDGHGRRRAQPRGEIGQSDAPMRRRQLGDQQQMAAPLAHQIVEMEQGALGARDRRVRSGSRRCASASAVRSANALALEVGAHRAARPRPRRPDARRDGSCRCPAGRSAPAPAPASRASGRSRPAPRDCRRRRRSPRAHRSAAAAPGRSVSCLTMAQPAAPPR